MHPHFPNLLVVNLLPFKIFLRRSYHTEVINFVLELKFFFEQPDFTLVPFNLILNLVYILLLGLIRKNSWPHRHLVKLFTVVFRATVRLTNWLKIRNVFYTNSWYHFVHLILQPIYISLVLLYLSRENFEIQFLTVHFLKFEWRLLFSRLVKLRET